VAIVIDRHPHRRLMSDYIDYFTGYGFGTMLLPVKPGDKKPMFGLRFDSTVTCVLADFGRKKMTTERLKQYWFRNPTCNLGLLTGSRTGIVVVDIDRPKHHGPERERFEWALRQVKDAKPLPGVGPTDTACYFTKRGVQLVYRQPCAMKGINGLALKELGLRVDVKADGGYVVVPPSVTASYRRVFLRDLSWLKELPIGSEVTQQRRHTAPRPGSIQFTKQPARLMFHSRGHPCAHRIVNLDVPKGRRDEVLFAFYNILLSADNTPEHASAKVREVNARFSAPMTTTEVAKCCSRKHYKLSCSAIRNRVPEVEPVCASCRKANNLLKIRTALHPTLIRKLVAKGLLTATAAALVLVATEQADGTGDTARYLGVTVRDIQKYFHKLREAVPGFLLGPLGQSHEEQP